MEISEKTRCQDTVNRGQLRMGEYRAKLFNKSVSLTERGRYEDALGMSLRCLYILLDACNHSWNSDSKKGQLLVESLDQLVDTLLMI